jgi:hypothetical protein
MNDAIAQLESIRSSVLSLFDERDAAQQIVVRARKLLE